MGYPANVSTVTVTGTWTYSDGSSTVPTGYVTFQPNTVLQDAGTSQIIDVKPLTATLDGSGHISVTLMNTSDVHLAPSGWAYTVTEHVAGSQRQYDVFITGTSVDLSALAPVSSTPQFGYVLTTSVGVIGGPAGPLDSGGKIPAGQIPFATPVAINTAGGSFGTNVSNGAPAPTAQNGPGSRTYLAGALLLAASQTFTANSVLATLPTAQRPAALGRWTVRTIGSSTQTLLAVDVDGTIKNLSAITAGGAGDTLPLDVVSFVHA